MSSKEGRASQYQVKPQSTGDILRVQIAPDGSQNQTLEKTTGETVLTRANGMQVVSKQAPDPRFGMQAPFTENLTVTTPAGLSREVKVEKTVELEDDNNPLSLKTLSTKVTTNERTSTRIYDAADRKVTVTSPESRKTVAYFDAKGRIIKDEVPDLVATYYHYDDRGRLVERIEGEGSAARTTTFTYDDDGNLSQLTDALERSAQLNYDAVGQILTETLPGDRQIHYAYDANGNTTRIVPPARPAHDFAYSSVDLNTEYVPPVLSTVAQPQTQYVYNLDKQLTHIHRPDGQVIEFVYDAVKERLTHLALPNNQAIHYHYDDSTGQVVTLTGVDSSTLTYTYDGSLVLSETWDNGSVNGSVTFDYNNDFRLAALNVNGQAVNYQYDDDGLLTQAGALNLNRNADNGLLVQTQLETLTTQRTYNQFGELSHETVSDGSQVHYETQYQYDKLGRITQKTEMVEGVSSTYVYHYDLAGRLDEVQQDGVVVEAYSYDANGNRLTAQGVTVAQYDDQDRLIQYGNNTYTYTDNGELRRKENNGQLTEYEYDVLGNLRSVQLPDGRQIEYVTDARDRRIGKKVNGQLVQSFLYQDGLNPVAELDSNGNVVTRFVYGTKMNVPDYMLKDGKTYRIVSNHLGSPRLVVDVSDGTVVQRMDYDAFGNVIFDSNPEFQPFGFAGGIYDADTKLTRFGARDYDAEIGRWTAKDPILFEGGDFNLYGYVINNPVNFIDVNGLEEQKPTDSSGNAGHTSNQRESNRNKHEEGDARRKMDRGGEKGDSTRRAPRRKPKGWKGSWPPRLPMPLIICPACDFILPYMDMDDPYRSQTPNCI